MITAKEISALQAIVSREIEARDFRLSKIELKPVPDPPPGPDTTKPPKPRPGPGPDPAPDAKKIFIPGTLTLFVAREGSAAMKELNKALATNEAAVADVLAKYQKEALNRKEVSVEEATKMMVSEEVFASVVYDGRELASGIFLPKGVEIAVVVFPYAGGALASSGLQLREHVREGSKASLSTLIVKADPKLTAAEKAAIRALPKERLGLQVGNAFSCDTTGAAVAAVVLVVVLVVVALATAGCVASVDAHIDEAMLKKLGNRASIKALLDLRRETIAKAAAANMR